MKKYIGFLLWILAFAIPFHAAILSTEEVGNIRGLISFVAMMALVFTGYLLVDSAGSPKQGESQGH